MLKLNHSFNLIQNFPGYFANSKRPSSYEFNNEKVKKGDDLVKRFASHFKRSFIKSNSIVFPLNAFVQVAASEFLKFQNTPQLSY